VWRKGERRDLEAEISEESEGSMTDGGSSLREGPFDFGGDGLAWWRLVDADDLGGADADEEGTCGHWILAKRAEGLGEFFGEGIAGGR